MAANLEAFADTGAFAKVGRWLGTRLHDDGDALRLVQRGISPQQFQRVLTKFDLSLDLPGSEASTRRRLRTGEHFTPDESERVLRVLRLLSEASSVFGSDAAALAWMQTPADLVAGEPAMSPMQLAESEIGGRRVETMIRRAAYGMY